jgi:hypothetical protein
VTPETCPHCGADLKRGAKACPECGSCEQTGWSEEASASGLGIPDHDFDYEEFTQREFGPKPKAIPRGISPFWWMVALGLVTLAVLGLLL